MWTPLYITLPVAIGLDEFVETVAQMMGGAVVEWRESSNYLEGRYAKLRMPDVSFKVCIADESEEVLSECHFQVDVDAADRFHDESEADKYAEEVAKRFIHSGWKAVLDVSRGKVNGELRHFK